MVKTPSFKRLILRAVLRQVSPMVIRLVSVADQMPLHEFHDVFRTILGWNGDLGYIVRVHILLQTRTKVLNEDLDDLLRRWCPRFRPHHKCRSQTATRLDPRLFGALVGLDGGFIHAKDEKSRDEGWFEVNRGQEHAR